MTFKSLESLNKFIRKKVEEESIIRVENTNNRKISWIDIYTLKTGVDSWIGLISGTAQCDMTIDDKLKQLTEEDRMKLLDLMVEYTKTPIEER